MTTIKDIDDPSLLRAARVAISRLSVQEKAQLVSELVQDIVAATAPAVTIGTSNDPQPRNGFARLREVAADIHAAYPETNVAARLDADRNERDALLRGEADDVHP